MAGIVHWRRNCREWCDTRYGGTNGAHTAHDATTTTVYLLCTCYDAMYVCSGKYLLLPLLHVRTVRQGSVRVRRTYGTLGFWCTRMLRRELVWQKEASRTCFTKKRKVKKPTQMKLGSVDPRPQIALSQMTLSTVPQMTLRR